MLGWKIFDTTMYLTQFDANYLDSANSECWPANVGLGKIKKCFLFFILEFRLELELELGLKLE